MVRVQIDGRRPAGVIGAAANARLVGQLRTVNETLGRSRALSPCGHFHPANCADTCSVREITRADLVLVPSAQSLPHGVRSGPGHSDAIAAEVPPGNGPDGRYRRTAPYWTRRMRPIVRSPPDQRCGRSVPKVTALNCEWKVRGSKLIDRTSITPRGDGKTADCSGSATSQTLSELRDPDHGEHDYQDLRAVSQHPVMQTPH
jgi:hypothetical protein